MVVTAAEAGAAAEVAAGGGVPATAVGAAAPRQKQARAMFRAVHRVLGRVLGRAPDSVRAVAIVAYRRIGCRPTNKSIIQVYLLFPLSAAKVLIPPFAQL